MLRDNFFTRMWREAMANGDTVHMTTTNDPNTPDEVTVGHAGQAINDTADRATAAADPYGLERSNNITFDDILRESNALQRQLRDSGNLAYFPYSSSFNTYTTLSPIHNDYAEIQAKLDELQKAIADMVVRRALAFREHGSSSDEKIIDYGYRLVNIFKELCPDQYATAMGSVEILKNDNISTDN